MSLPMLCIASESYLASLMKAEQKPLIYSSPFHSPERIQKRKHKTRISNSQNTPLLANKVDAKHLFFRYNEIAMLYLAKTNHSWVTCEARKLTLPPLVAAHSCKPLLKNLFLFRGYRGTNSFQQQSMPCARALVPKHFYWIHQPCLEVLNYRASELSSSHKVVSPGSGRWILQMKLWIKLWVETM